MINSNEKKQINVISMSGGKDSTAMALIALERGGDNRFLFSDTGHEHEMTYQYLDYLREKLGIQIETVKADFSEQIERKKAVVRGKWVREGAVTKEQAERICELLVPTGIPFLDLCLWKGRFPSTRARFCSEELKHGPLTLRQLEITKEGPVISWQGVRADESRNRANLPEHEKGDYCLIYRPILKWTVEDVFDQHRKHGIEPNPLYKLGMSRVGCMPCIHARKSELAEIARRFPAELERVQEWERIVSKISKLGMATFYHSGVNPYLAVDVSSRVNHDEHGIMSVAEWAKTTRGGRQFDLLASDEPPMCSSAYGLCE